MKNEIDIKTLRKLKGWTLGQMADRFGVNLSTVWRWENNKIPGRGAARAALEMEWATVSQEASQ